MAYDAIQKMIDDAFSEEDFNAPSVLSPIKSIEPPADPLVVEQAANLAVKAETREVTEANIPTPSKQVYCDYFLLNETPFSITPDTRFYFARNSCKIALNTINFAIRSGEGFIKVVGEVGTGKTTLCRKFLNEAQKHYITAYIPNPQIEPMTLLMAIADEIGVEYPQDANQHQLLKALNYFLINSYAKYRKSVIVCIDEAHTMPIGTLEMLRLLSNLETQQAKLLQLVLFGQPELDRRLSDPAIRQLKQRISFSCVLVPLSLQDVEDYVSHRLNISGYSGSRLFDKQALRLLYQASEGLPRLVNILAHKALMAAFGEGKRNISKKHVKLAIDDTEYAVAIMNKRALIWRKRLVLGTLVAFGLVALALVIGSRLV